MFARPGFEQEKATIAYWFAGYDFSSLLYKLKTDRDSKFVERSERIITGCINDAYQTASRIEKKVLIDSLNKVLGNESPLSNIQELSNQLAMAVKISQDAAFYDDIDRMITPVVTKSQHR